ncbi:ribosome-associated translation inhibitor RaiA [Ahniella affigens]|uniref:Ribosome hibernation promoting factor n=1 Tax=Ahniella affigens TaxID=2021234 RepID=A0A2P1PN37_9GAMM|nr:ribosome-associated translation inhibitor RaiA [Ahniella affigens]AVP96260.1 ribosome-associated translation inhibitor RaiA [Ahniella affigens]
MHIEVSGHGVEVTGALRDYANDKMGRVVRHFDHMTGAHVILSLEKLKHRAECTLNVSQRRIHAEAESSDMYAAIDALVDKLDGQVKKHKEKLQEHRRDQMDRDLV